MSAEIPSTMPLSDLLKSTGFNCPESMQGKTFDEATSGGADLEDNKEATIDVSAYTDPVEITPTAGKDGMKKVTVSCTNIPAGANMLYAWTYTDSTYGTPVQTIYTQSATPSVNDPVLWYDVGQSPNGACLKIDAEYGVEAYDPNANTIEWDGIAHSRNTQGDIEVWNAPPEVETTKQATIDVSTYDPTNKPVITPTAGKQSMAEVEVTLSNIPSGGSDIPYFIQCSDSPSYSIPILIVPDITKLSIFIATLDTNLTVLSSDENRVGWHSSSDFDFESENVGDNGLSLAGYGVYGIYTYGLDLYPSSLKYDGQLYNFPQDLNHVTKNPCIPVSTQALIPTSDIPSGTVASGTIVSLSTTETDGEIFYSIDGSAFIAYADGIEITETCSIRAVTVVDGKAVSEELVLNFEVE